MTQPDTPVSAETARVRKAAATILVATLNGDRGSVSALAAAVGLTRPTLYRRHPDDVDLFNAGLEAIKGSRTRPVRTRRSKPGDVEKLREQNATLRAQNETYAEVIRQLTLELRSLRAKAGDVTELRARPRRR